MPRRAEGNAEVQIGPPEPDDPLTGLPQRAQRIQERAPGHSEVPDAQRLERAHDVPLAGGCYAVTRRRAFRVFRLRSRRSARL